MIEKTKMNDAQRNALRDLASRYNVEFDESNFFVYRADASMMPGWAEGRVGPIYVGCSPEGQIHS